MYTLQKDFRYFIQAQEYDTRSSSCSTKTE